MEVIARTSGATREEAAGEADLPIRQYNQWGFVWRRFLRHRMAVVGACLIVLMLALAILGPLISPGYVPFLPSIGGPPLWAHAQENMAPRVWPPHWRFLMGTDAAANPVITFVLEGGRPLLLIGFLGALIASIVGAVIGSMAGYLGGVVDAVLMRIVDAFLAVPFLLLLVLFSQQLGENRGPFLYAVMFGLLGWPGVARLVRGYILTLREREFAEAAKALGTTSWGIILRHLLPNALDVLVVSFTLNIAVFLVTEVTLDFLGAGTSSTTWGTPLSGAFADLIDDNWWVGTFPAIPIVITALGFNFLGDGLRDALDATSPTALITAPQKRKRRRPGPISTTFNGVSRALAAGSLALSMAIVAGRSSVRSALLTVPGAQRLRAAGAEPRGSAQPTAPLAIRVLPPVLVAVALGVAMLYGHSPLVYSPNYSSPAAYGPIYDASEYGAAASQSGGWNILTVDETARLAYLRVDARAHVTSARVLGPGSDNSQPALAMRGTAGLGAWIGGGGARVYAARLGDRVSPPFALNPAGGTVQNPTVALARGSFMVLFGWQPPGAYSGFDIYLSRVPVTGKAGAPMRLVRSGDYALYPEAVADGSGNLDVAFLRRFSPGQYFVEFQRFALNGVPLSRPRVLGHLDYLLPGSNGCTIPDPEPPGQWALDIKRAVDGTVWAAWATGTDCATKDGISGVNSLSVGHWSKDGRVLLPPTPVDPAMDPSGQAVALATQGKGGTLYYAQPGTVESHLVATKFGASGQASVPQRVNYEGGGNVANPRAGTVAGKPVVIWERARVRTTELVGTSYHSAAQPDLLTRLGLNLGSLWGNIALLVFGGLGGGIAIALANIYLTAPLILVWVVVRRMPPVLRWPAFLAAIAILLSWVFAVHSSLPGYVLVITEFGYPDAWLAVAGAVFVAGWTGHYFLARQESAMRATGMALISLYFVAVMYAVIYIESQIGKI